MRLRAVAGILYYKGHFIKPGGEFELPADEGIAYVEAGLAEEIPGGSGETVNLAETPAPDVAFLSDKKPVPQRRKKKE